MRWNVALFSVSPRLFQRYKKSMRILKFRDNRAENSREIVFTQSPLYSKIRIVSHCVICIYVSASTNAEGRAILTADCLKRSFATNIPIAKWVLLNVVMTKHKNMKLSSRKNGTLVPDEDSDSDLQEFPLPKKRIIKPGKSTYVARSENWVVKTVVSCEQLKSWQFIFYDFVLKFIIHFRTFQKTLWLLSCVRFGVPFSAPYCFSFVCNCAGMVQSETETRFRLREEALE